MNPKRKYPQGLLVSRKFFNDIISRIRHALALEVKACEQAESYVCAYLCGQREAEKPCGLAAVVIDLLLPELDRAMKRSLRAREISRRRRGGNASESRSASPSASTSLFARIGAETTAEAETAEPAIPMNRHQRRLLQRLMRKKELRDAKAARS